MGAKTSVSAAADRRASIEANEPGENPRRNAATPTRVSVHGGQLLGYARVSTADQLLDRQRDSLTEAGCDRIFEDRAVSGTRAPAARPGWQALEAHLRAGDTVVVQALDRLGRNTRDLLALVDELRGRGVHLRILTLGVDTATPAGQLVLTIIAALAQMEREILAERVRDGLAAARQRGRTGGRPPALTAEQRQEAIRQHSEGRPLAELARLLGCSERTIRRVVNGA